MFHRDALCCKENKLWRFGRFSSSSNFLVVVFISVSPFSSRPSHLSLVSFLSFPFLSFPFLSSLFLLYFLLSFQSPSPDFKAPRPSRNKTSSVCSRYSRDKDAVSLPSSLFPRFLVVLQPRERRNERETNEPPPPGIDRSVTNPPGFGSR